jgi:hypothetical protein
MQTDTDHRYPSGVPEVTRPHRPRPETIDLDDPAAVRRAIAVHQAGKAVFAIPFNTPGDGTLTWLNPDDASPDR